MASAVAAQARQRRLLLALAVIAAVLLALFALNRSSSASSSPSSPPTAPGLVATAPRRAAPAPATRASFDDLHEHASRRAAQRMSQLGTTLFETALRALAASAPDESLVLSPFSLGMALHMLTEGASGAGREELLQALGLSDNDEVSSLSRDIMALAHWLAASDSGSTVSVTNGMWVPSSAVSAAYIDRVQRQYESDVLVHASADEVNAWVADASNGLIDSVVTSDMERSTILALINVVYFHGRWLSKFDKAATQVGAPFTLPSGRKTEASMMHREGKMLYHETESAQMISLPYEAGDDQTSFELVVVLPSSELGAEEARAAGIAGLTALSQPATSDDAVRLSKQEGHLGLPRMRLSGSRVLNDDLQALGVRAVFAPGSLEAIAPRALVDKVLQKTVLRVDEEGTEAAAATVVSVARSMVRPAGAPFNMICDRPFFAGIRDSRTRALLFWAFVAEPEPSS